MDIITIAIIFFATFFAIFFFFANICFKKLVKQAMTIEIDLKQNGIITEGRIIRHSHPFLLLVPALVYSYQHEGKFYQNKQYIRRGDFRTSKDGTPVFVRYLSDDPKNAILVDFKSTAMNAQYYHFMANMYLQLAIAFTILAIFGCIELIKNVLH